jgi:uncharacterized protein DUF1918
VPADTAEQRWLHRYLRRFAGEPAGVRKVNAVTGRSTTRRDGPTAPGKLRAEVGDLLVIDQGGMAGTPNIGVIIGVPSADGSPPYLVRWIAGEYESTVVPGEGAHIEKIHRPSHPDPGVTGNGI